MKKNTSKLLLGINKDFQIGDFKFKNYVNLDENEIYLIWIKRNSVEVREWMTNDKEISLDEHRKFINSLKDAENKKYWLCLYNDIPIGSFCLNPYVNNDYGEIGSYLFPDYIGKGLGSKAKSLFVNYFLDNNLVNYITAKVKIHNERNIHVNHKLGFFDVSSDNIYTYMKITKLELCHVEEK